MPTIRFRGEAARRLWGHVKGHLDLLRRAVRGLDAHGQDDPIAVARMVSFLVTAAWGYCAISDRQYGSRTGRFEYLASINRDIYRLSPSRGRTEVLIELAGGRPEVLDLGPLDGFSGMLPLTRRGYEAYMLGGVPMSELNNQDEGAKHLVEGGYAPHSVEFVLISGLVHFPALPHFLIGRTRFRRCSRALLRSALGQLGRFLPRVKPVVNRQSRIRFVQRVDQTSRSPIHVLCPISGRGMGESLVRTAGFRPIRGRDQRRNRVFDIDLMELDSRTMGEGRMRRIATAVIEMNKQIVI